MDPPHTNQSEAEIDNRICALRQQGQRLMFSHIAESLPDCTWQRLFSALGRLSKRNQVKLLAHKWDYEIIFLGTAGSSRALGRHASDEMARM